MKLASIPKRKLNIHDESNVEFSQKKVISMTFEQSIALKSLLKELDAVGSEIVDERNVEQLEMPEQVPA